MGVREILASLFRAQPGRDGMWDFLSKHAVGKNQVELERAAGKNRVDLEETRNRGTQMAIRALPAGGVLREGGPDWSREIRIPDQLPAAVISIRATGSAIGHSGVPQLRPPAGQPGGAAGGPCA